MDKRRHSTRAALAATTAVCIAAAVSGCGLAQRNDGGGAAALTGDPPAIESVAGFVGDQPGVTGGRFLEPTDVAVRSSDGTTFVVEGLPSNSRVQRLDANGNFELAWGRDVVRAGRESDTGRGFEICRDASSCQAGRRGDNAGELDRPNALAVHPASGDVYVVDSGNGRIQQFRADGSFVRSWPLAIAGAVGGFEEAAITIGPAAPHYVFVADNASNRVLQFTAGGDFVRAWGWGVGDGGGDSFQACTDRDSCRTGRPVGRRRSGRPAAWPGEIAVDAHGVVLGSVHLGDLFDSEERRTWIVRFRSEPPPDTPDATDALLAPLKPFDVYSTAERKPFEITNGATLGLDIHARSGALLAINNPFGVSQIDVVDNPAAGLRDRPPPRTRAVQLPFLQNVSGIAAGGTGDVVYLASGAVDQPTGRSTFTGCSSDDAERDCHGLIVLAPAGPARALLTTARRRDHRTIVLGALIDAHGTVSYRFESSHRRGRWRPLGERRYATGVGYEEVASGAIRLRPGRIHLVRVTATKKTDDGIVSTTSNAMPVLIERPAWRR